MSVQKGLHTLLFTPRFGSFMAAFYGIVCVKIRASRPAMIALFKHE